MSSPTTTTRSARTAHGVAYRPGDGVDALWFSAWVFRWAAARLPYYSAITGRSSARPIDDSYTENAEAFRSVVSGCFVLLTTQVFSTDRFGPAGRVGRDHHSADDGAAGGRAAREPTAPGRAGGAGNASPIVRRTLLRRRPHRGCSRPDQLTRAPRRRTWSERGTQSPWARASATSFATTIAQCSRPRSAATADPAGCCCTCLAPAGRGTRSRRSGSICARPRRRRPRRQLPRRHGPQRARAPAASRAEARRCRPAGRRPRP